MATVYLNKNVRFKCSGGNAVYFKPVDGASKVTVSGATVLLEDCKLQLIGPIRFGQCKYTTNPATNSPPGPCRHLLILKGNWEGMEKVSITISGKRPLDSRSFMKCGAPLGVAKIEPFKPTYKPLTVDNGASRVSVKIGVPASESAADASSPNRAAQTPGEGSGQVLAETLEVQSPQETPSPDSGEDKQDSTPPSDEYTLCAMNRSEACETCEYRNASHVPAETDESKNAAALKKNMETLFNSYIQETGRIEQLTLEKCRTYSSAHHHLIPVNQCFKGNPKLVKLANYYKYDINNALNGICLPSATDGYSGQSVERRRDVAFYAMKKLRLQWHVGGHQTTIPEKVDARLLKPFQSYKDQVDKLLDMFIARHFKKAGCRAESYDMRAKKFHADMDELCGKVRERVLKFGVNPQDSGCIYVSKMSLYYAFYKELREYQDILFKDSKETADDE